MADYAPPVQNPEEGEPCATPLFKDLTNFKLFDNTDDTDHDPGNNYLHRDAAFGINIYNVCDPPKQTSLTIKPFIDYATGTWTLDDDKFVCVPTPDQVIDGKTLDDINGKTLDEVQEACKNITCDASLMGNTRSFPTPIEDPYYPVVEKDLKDIVTNESATFNADTYECVVATCLDNDGKCVIIKD